MYRFAVRQQNNERVLVQLASAPVEGKKSELTTAEHGKCGRDWDHKFAAVV